ncbi:MAG: PBP1 and LysM peptidoglycan-binding domain-containing protein [Phocaeicola sp.]
MKFIKTVFLAAALSATTLGAMAQTEPGSYFLHTITKGQSLYSIASMYGLSTGDIIQLNPGSETLIKAGGSLKIPQLKTEKNHSTFHTIGAGDTLYKLTRQYNKSAAEICEANPGLSAENFRIGQVIVIPTQPDSLVTTPAPTEANNEPNHSKFRDMHKVERKETIYSISRMYGLTEEELINANPELRTEKLKRGKFLAIPYQSSAKPTVNTEKEKPVSNEELFRTSKKRIESIGTIKAAVLLPFMVDGKNREEQSRMVEYYEGFLLAVDSLKRSGVSMDLYAYDTGNTVESLQKVLAKEELKKVDVIFGPAHSEQVKEAGSFAQKHGIRLVVPFSSKGDEVFNNPAIFQVKTPQSYLYSEVYDHFIRKFGADAQVIFLETGDGDIEKIEFIKGLKEELKNKQIPFKELKGDQIQPERLKEQMSQVLDNIFIPTSGTNSALTKILPQLIVASRESPENRVKLFGYPEWQTYTNDYLASFYELDTYFYTSFYTNTLFPEAVNFSRSYRRMYSKDMSNTFPKYGMLGFDTAYYFLKGLARYGGDIENKMNNIEMTPIQTGFKFERVNNWGGFINRKVFFVHFTKNYELVKLNFE